jgi:hypothetical protein
MARFLVDRDSTALHLQTARRHQRLARRYGLSTYATDIQPQIDALKARAEEYEERELDRQAAYDELQAADSDLDDTVRNLHSSAQSFDRDHLGAGTLTTLFPDNRFTSVTDLPVTQELTAIEGLITRLSSLDPQHTLAPFIQKLQDGKKAVVDALAAQNTAVINRATANAQEELAQAALRRQYEINYHNAAKQLGKAGAEKLFPDFRSSAKSSEKAAPAPTPEASKPA